MTDDEHPSAREVLGASMFAAGIYTLVFTGILRLAELVTNTSFFEWGSDVYGVLSLIVFTTIMVAFFASNGFKNRTIPPLYWRAVFFWRYR
ncbi:MAG: hypothetical protein WC683_15005 [bacterium]